MKTALLLERLQNQLIALRAQATPLMGHATLKPRFDRQLFRTRSTVIQDYLAEAQTNLDELRHAVENEQQEQVAWLAEHLTEQITALHREIAAWPLRAWDSGSRRLDVANRMGTVSGRSVSRLTGSTVSRTGSTISRAGFGSTGRAYSSGG